MWLSLWLSSFCVSLLNFDGINRPQSIHVCLLCSCEQRKAITATNVVYFSLTKEIQGVFLVYRSRSHCPALSPVNLISFYDASFMKYFRKYVLRNFADMRATDSYISKWKSVCLLQTQWLIISKNVQKLNRRGWAKMNCNVCETWPAGKEIRVLQAWNPWVLVQISKTERGTKLAPHYIWISFPLYMKKLSYICYNYIAFYTN